MTYNVRIDFVYGFANAAFIHSVESVLRINLNYVFLSFMLNYIAHISRNRFSIDESLRTTTTKKAYFL